MKILNILYDERIGGPQKRVIQVAQKLQPEIETIVVIPKGDSKFFEKLQAYDIKTYRISLKRLRDTRNIFIHVIWFFFWWVNIFEIIKIINLEDIDVVHSNGILNSQGSIAAQLTGRRVIWHINSINSRKIVNWVMIPIFSILANIVVVSSEAVKDYYYSSTPKILQKETFLLYPPVDVNTYKPNRDKSDQEEKLIVGMIGNVNPIKGYETFIKAAALIKHENSKVSFIIIGQILKSRKRYYLNLRDLIANLGLDGSINFLGQHDDVLHLLNKLTIYVHTAKSEAFGMSIAEAMSCSIPVVASKVGGIPELVGDSGILFNQGDYQSVANAVIHLLGNPGKRIKLGRASRKRIIELFSLDHCVKQHEHLYLEVINRHKYFERR